MRYPASEDLNSFHTEEFLVSDINNMNIVSPNHSDSQEENRNEEERIRKEGCHNTATPGIVTIAENMNYLSTKRNTFRLDYNRGNEA